MAQTLHPELPRLEYILANLSDDDQLEIIQQELASMGLTTIQAFELLEN